MLYVRDFCAKIWLHASSMSTPICMELGIRLELYLQWFSAILAKLLVPKKG